MLLDPLDRRSLVTLVLPARRVPVDSAADVTSRLQAELLGFGTRALSLASLVQSSGHRSTRHTAGPTLPQRLTLDCIQVECFLLAEAERCCENEALKGRLTTREKSGHQKMQSYLHRASHLCRWASITIGDFGSQEEKFSINSELEAKREI